jgi:hypothetical protein
LQNSDFIGEKMTQGNLNELHTEIQQKHTFAVVGFADKDLKLRHIVTNEEVVITLQVRGVERSWSFSKSDPLGFLRLETTDGSFDWLGVKLHENDFLTAQPISNTAIKFVANMANRFIQYEIKFIRVSSCNIELEQNGLLQFHNMQ